VRLSLSPVDNIFATPSTNILLPNGKYPINLTAVVTDENNTIYFDPTDSNASQVNKRTHTQSQHSLIHTQLMLTLIELVANDMEFIIIAPVVPSNLGQDVISDWLDNIEV
jgi:hypothetical protein